MKIIQLLILTTVISLFGETIQFQCGNSLKQVTQWNATNTRNGITLAPNMLAVFRRDKMTTTTEIAINSTKNSYHGFYSGIVVYKFDEISPTQLSLFQSDSSFVNVMKAEVNDKIARNIWDQLSRQYVDSIARTMELDIFFEHNTPLTSQKNLFQSVGATIRYQPDGISIKSIVATFEQVLLLVQAPFVASVGYYQESHPLSNNARDMVSVSDVQGDLSIPATGFVPTPEWAKNTPYVGNGITISNGEYSSYDYRHLDLCEVSTNDTILRLSNKVVKLRDGTAWGLTAHGTATAALAMGNGWASNGKYRGIAPKAKLANGHGYLSNGRTPSDDTADINTHSFISGDSGIYNDYDTLLDTRYATHNETSMKADRRAGRIGVFGSANNGNVSSNGSQRGFFSILQNKKNGIIVGGSYSDRALLWPGSSQGPTRSGQIKPDVVAPAIGLFDQRYTVEFDSIAIVNNGVVKYASSFTDHSQTWCRSRIENGHLVFDDFGNDPYTYSDFKKSSSGITIPLCTAQVGLTAENGANHTLSPRGLHITRIHTMTYLSK